MKRRAKWQTFDQQRWVRLGSRWDGHITVNLFLSGRELRVQEGHMIPFGINSIAAAELLRRLELSPEGEAYLRSRQI